MKTLLMASQLRGGETGAKCELLPFSGAFQPSSSKSSKRFVICSPALSRSRPETRICSPKALGCETETMTKSAPKFPLYGRRFSQAQFAVIRHRLQFNGNCEFQSNSEWKFCGRSTLGNALAPEVQFQVFRSVFLSVSSPQFSPSDRQNCPQSHVKKTEARIFTSGTFSARLCFLIPFLIWCEKGFLTCLRWRVRGGNLYATCGTPVCMCECASCNFLSVRVSWCTSASMWTWRTAT